MAGALRVEHADSRRAAELIASAQHPSWLCGRRRSCARRRRPSPGCPAAARSAEDARLSAMTGAALTICERLTRRPSRTFGARSSSPRGDDPFALVYAAKSHGWLCEYRAARDLAAARAGGRAGTGSGGIGRRSRASCSRSTVDTLGDFDAAGAIWADTVRTAEEAEQPHTLAWSRMSLGVRRGHPRGRGGGATPRRQRARARSSRCGSWAWRVRPGCSPPRRSRAATARPPPGCSPTRTSRSARPTTPR